MFRKSLLAATALILTAPVAFAAHVRGMPGMRFRPGHVPIRVGATLLIGKTDNHGAVRNNTPHDAHGAIFSNFSKDKNAEFVSWYGLTAQYSESSHYVSQSSHYKVSMISFNATRFTGTGRAPKSLTIPGFGYEPSYKYEGAILSSVDGLPGKVIATTSSTTWSDTSLCCTAARTVKFSDAPKLEKGKQYFVAVECANAPCVGGWNVENTDFSGDAVDFFRVKIKETYNFHYGHTYTYSYSSSPGSGSPVVAVGAFILK